MIGFGLLGGLVGCSSQENTPSQQDKQTEMSLEDIYDGMVKEMNTYALEGNYEAFSNLFVTESEDGVKQLYDQLAVRTINFDEYASKVISVTNTDSGEEYNLGICTFNVTKSGNDYQSLENFTMTFKNIDGTYKAIVTEDSAATLASHASEQKQVITELESTIVSLYGRDDMVNSNEVAEQIIDDICGNDATVCESIKQVFLSQDFSNNPTSRSFFEDSVRSAYNVQKN